MVISHEHEYLFVEVPHTATSAISRELCEHYGGEKILFKHATWYDFRKVASERERGYFVVAGIRNPLDDAVSEYFKQKTDHRRMWSDPEKRRKHSFRSRRRREFSTRSDVEFADYFRKFFKLAYNNVSLLSSERSDFVIRFENLQEDFATALEKIGLEPLRPLPVVNRTAGRRDYRAYYTPDVVPRAVRIFGPFMEEWGYDFPDAWGDVEVKWHHRLEYRVVNRVREAYWKHVAPRLPSNRRRAGRGLGESAALPRR